MERYFTQREWHHIDIANLADVDRVADRAGEVGWGVRRTIAEHLTAGRVSGLRADAVYVLSDDFAPLAVRSGSLTLSLPTWSDSPIAVSFQRA
jgi:hypothetical protein